jgi:hypothetical protein
LYSVQRAKLLIEISKEKSKVKVDQEVFVLCNKRTALAIISGGATGGGYPPAFENFD